MKRIGVVLVVLFSLVMAASFSGAKDSGTVSVGGKTWLKNASCLNSRSWDGAQGAVASLKNGDCDLADGSKAGDWRLPTISELKTMCDNKGKFTDVIDTGYWSSK